MFRAAPLHRARKCVSIGGWCGPALILGKLGVRTEAYPFDFSRCTLDGVIHFIRHGFDEGFYPPGKPPYTPECVGIWVLYRGQHTAFAHFDLNDSRVRNHFSRKMQRWDSLLDTPSAPGDGVTFFRTIAARDPREELKLISLLEAAIQERNPQLDYRIVVMAHDQGLVARSVELQPLSPRTTLWALAYTEDDTHILFDRVQRAYTDVVVQSLDEDNWPADPSRIPLPAGISEREGDVNQRVLHTAPPASGVVPFADLTVDRFPWRCHDNIALIDGVASVGGTCTGVGSTRSVNGICPFCGNSDGHKAGRPFRTERPFTTEEDEVLVAHLYKILTGGDKVEAVEQLAHELNRGAFEIICRIQFLTNSSTKLTDFLNPDAAAA